MVAMNWLWRFCRVAVSMVLLPGGSRSGSGTRSELGFVVTIEMSSSRVKGGKCICAMPGFWRWSGRVDVAMKIIERLGIYNA